VPIIKRENNKLLISCDFCQKQFTRFVCFENRTFHFCSKTCYAKENKKGGKVRKLIEETSIEKYGYSCSSQAESVKEKQKETNLKKYSHTSSAMNNDVKEKAKNTCIEKYQHISPMQDKEIQQKSKQTCLKNHNVQYPQQSEDIRKKSKKTCLKQFGTEHASQSTEIKDKIKKTCIEKFGFSNAMQNEQIRNKQMQTLYERYGVINPSQSKEIRAKIDYQSIAKKAHKTMKQRKNYGKSKIEETFHNTLNVIFNNKNIERQCVLDKWSIDFYITSMKLYIQFDGVYWHGLNRSLETIKLFKNKRDEVIYQTYLRDQMQNNFCKINNINLLRITDQEFKKAKNPVEFIKQLFKQKKLNVDFQTEKTNTGSQ